MSGILIKGRTLLMTKQVKILFTDDVMVCKSKQLKKFIEYEKNNFSMPFINGKLSVVIKLIDEERQQLDKIRMIAGAIARELSCRKIKGASIDGESLSKAFIKFERDSVITSFVEGWHLGTY